MKVTSTSVSWYFARKGVQHCFFLLCIIKLKIERKLMRKQRHFHHSTTPVLTTNQSLTSLSLTHLPKVDILTLSAAAARIPQGVATPCSPPTSISSSHVLLCGPFTCLGLSRWRFSLKKWLMPVYFREAKPFGKRGVGEWRTKTKEERKWEGRRN